MSISCIPSVLVAFSFRIDSQCKLTAVGRLRYHIKRFFHRIHLLCLKKMKRVADKSVLEIRDGPLR